MNGDSPKNHKTEELKWDLSLFGATNSSGLPSCRFNVRFSNGSSRDAS